ncbi:DMT family transporter [Spiractinospora alimapuensis]|uniref:DMT family transporter n=1 Tax=Spiractinospora alimapuensis TaxID=2820884 RepID=UPI001F43A7E7|nr:DMT family transporter [Spiractinospora alimapuensis]
MTNHASTGISPRHALPVLAASVTIVLWASAFVGVRAAGHDYSPGALTVGRQIAGSIVLTGIVLARAVFTGRAPRLPKGRRLLGVIVWGMAWFGLYNIALNSAAQYLDAGTTALIVNIAPVLIAVLAGLMLGEGFPLRLGAGMAVAFAGVAVIAIATSTGRHDLLGVGLGVVAAVTYACSATAQKRLLEGVDALTMTWIGCVAGTVATLPFTPTLVRETATASSTSTLVVVLLGVFPTAIAFLTWGYALTQMKAGQLAASTYVIPALVVLFSWLILSETPAALSFAGGALCLVGVAIATLRRRSTKPDDRSTTKPPGERAPSSV